MHIQVINYQKTFNLGNYSSERIGIEVAINPGESAKEALDTARGLVEEYHAENVKRQKELLEFLGVGYETVPEKVIPTQSPKTLAEKTKYFIDQCKNEGELKAWELMSKSNPELLEYYNDKLKSFKTK
jgi:hypothetical protein